MFYLKNLITDKTPILNLHNDFDVSLSKKANILGLINASETRKIDYLKMMYIMNNVWYYFKKEEENKVYPFFLIDELMGSFLTQTQKMNAVTYFIASVKGYIGIASQNFKEDGFDYFFGNYYREQYYKRFGQYPTSGISNIEDLKILCKDPLNAENFINHFLKMLAIDVYMLQRDRNSSNFQFQIDKKTHKIDLAPLYDFSNCLASEDYNQIIIKNEIMTLDSFSLRLIIKKYPQFLEYLNFLIDQGMSSIWNNICEYYCLNQNCEAYEQVLNYYQTKEEDQRKTLRNVIVDLRK